MRAVWNPSGALMEIVCVPMGVLFWAARPHAQSMNGVLSHLAPGRRIAAGPAPSPCCGATSGSQHFRKGWPTLPHWHRGGCLRWRSEGNKRRLPPLLLLRQPNRSLGMAQASQMIARPKSVRGEPANQNKRSRDAEMRHQQPFHDIKRECSTEGLRLRTSVHYLFVIDLVYCPSRESEIAAGHRRLGCATRHFKYR